MEYLTDKQHGLVKIIERNNNYFVYPLKTMVISKKRGGMYGNESYRFIFATKSVEKHSYKPYEDEDTTNPQWEVDYIKRMHNHKISRR